MNNKLIALALAGLMTVSMTGCGSSGSGSSAGTSAGAIWAWASTKACLQKAGGLEPSAFFNWTVLWWKGGRRIDALF